MHAPSWQKSRRNPLRLPRQPRHKSKPRAPCRECRECRNARKLRNRLSLSQVLQVSQRPRARNHNPRPRLGLIGWNPMRAHIWTGYKAMVPQPMARWQALWAGAQLGLGRPKPSCARSGWCRWANLGGRCRPKGRSHDGATAAERKVEAGEVNDADTTPLQKVLSAHSNAGTREAN